MLTLNIGCGTSHLGDIRLDVKKTKTTNIVSDAHNLPFRSAIFDKIFYTEVFEHLGSPIRALIETHRVLKDRGSVFISVPNITEWRRIISIIRHPLYVHKATITDHKQGWDAIDFHLLTRQVGFKIIQIDWLDWYGREGRKDRLKFLDPFLKYILPKSLFYTHMSIVCKKISRTSY